MNANGMIGESQAAIPGDTVTVAMTVTGCQRGGYAVKFLRADGTVCSETVARDEVRTNEGQPRMPKMNLEEVQHVLRVAGAR